MDTPPGVRLFADDLLSILTDHGFNSPSQNKGSAARRPLGVVNQAGAGAQRRGGKPRLQPAARRPKTKLLAARRSDYSPEEAAFENYPATPAQAYGFKDTENADVKPFRESTALEQIAEARSPALNEETAVSIDIDSVTRDMPAQAPVYKKKPPVPLPKPQRVQPAVTVEPPAAVAQADVEINIESDEPSLSSSATVTPERSGKTLFANDMSAIRACHTPSPIPTPAESPPESIRTWGNGNVSTVKGTP